MKKKHLRIILILAATSGLVLIAYGVHTVQEVRKRLNAKVTVTRMRHIANRCNIRIEGPPSLSRDGILVDTAEIFLELRPEELRDAWGHPIFIARESDRDRHSYVIIAYGPSWKPDMEGSTISLAQARQTATFILGETGWLKLPEWTPP